MKTDGPLIRDFAATFCRHTKGEWAGQLVTFEDWQASLIDDLFQRRPEGRRKHRIGLIGMPRKNGKSTMGSALAVYGLVGEGEAGAEVYSCAGDRQQARIVFEEAKKMVQADPELSQVVKVYRDVLEYRGGVYRVLSADAKLQQGLNPSMVLFDELHVQPNDELWTAMTLGSGTRREPIIIAITTAGLALEGSLCYRLYQYGQQILNGEVDDPTFFFRWWEARHPDGSLWPDCDYRDPVALRSANPASFRKIETLLDEVRITPEGQARRYILNQHTAFTDAWLEFGAWARCLDEEREAGTSADPWRGLDPALPVHAGIDVSIKDDSTAVAAAQRQAERVVIRARVWENPFPMNTIERETWRVPQEEVRQTLRDLFVAFPVPACEVDGKVAKGPRFNYDPAYFWTDGAELAAEGLAMVRCSQSDSVMVPACTNLRTLILQGVASHDDNPALNRHMNNAQAVEKENGIRLSKRKATQKIDGAIATALATYSVDDPAPAADDRIYRGRRLLVI